MKNDVGMPIKKIKFGDLFEYENKSRIKAGDGLAEGEYPFYTSSSILSKYLDEYTFDKTSLTHIARQPDGMRAYTRLSGFRSFCLCTTDFILVKGRCLMPRVSNNCFNFCSGSEHFFTDISCSALL